MRTSARWIGSVAVAAPIFLLVTPAHAAMTDRGLWHMDSVPMSDSSGFGNDGTLTHVSLISDGVTGSAYHFDQSDSKVTAPNSASLNPGAQDFSYTLHVRFPTAPDSTTGDFDLIRKGLAGTSGGEWKMEILRKVLSTDQVLGNPSCLFKDSAGVTDSIRGSQNLADDAWHTITCEKLSTADHLIVDGVTTTSTPSKPLGSISNTAPVVLGQKLGGGDQYIGDMDEGSVQIGSASTGGGDTTAPTVTARSPGINATGVAVSANVTATFNEAVQGVDTSTFTLVDPIGASVPAGVTKNSTTNKWTLNPSTNLASNSTYTVTLTGGATAIRDMADNPLATTPTWSFTTAADTTAPTVTARSPGINATGVAVSANVTATFNEAVQGVDTDTFTLADTTTGALVPATVTRSGTTNKWILNPSSNLAHGTNYTATLTGGVTAIRDMAGNPLATTPPWGFTTG